MANGYVYKDKISGKLYYGIAYQDVDGTWTRTRTKGTKALALKRLETEETAVETAKSEGFHFVKDWKAKESKNAGLTFAEFSSDYLDSARALVKPSTYARYSDIMTRYLVPWFGKDSLAVIDAERIEKYRDHRLDPKRGGASKATVHQEISILSGLFLLAMRRKKISIHPIKGGMVKKPKLDKRTPRYLSSEEKSALLAHATEPLKSAIVIAMNTGLRESELAGLTWANVDTERRTITIHERKSGVPLVIPYNDTVAETLKGLKRYLKIPYVFVSARGKSRFDRFNNTAWRKAIKDAGIKNFRWHDLRSHYGCSLAQKGRTSKEIQALLGQSSLASTEKYLAVAPENLEAAVRSIDPKKALRDESATKGTTNLGELAAG